MEVFEHIGSVASSLIYFALGSRLTLLGARTRSGAEWLIGLTFLSWGAYYALWFLSIGLHSQSALEFEIFITARAIDCLGMACFAFFPLLAFRRGSTWAKWLAASLAICVIAGIPGSSWAGDPKGVSPLTNFWWWLEWLGSVGSGVWIGVEGIHHYGITRARVRLGLCEPIVGHRYLLWGLAGVFWTLLDIIVIGQYVDFWATQTWSSALENLVGLLEIAALAMVWLVYFAPAAYQRKINAPAASA
ncbi:MAG: hypothetical protein JRE43_10605 [Deltaproteobacteria bacterium]|nr:hypothetical protein [Deltaproteobacteria bacterium]MBW2542790.1 hypothetical protein [Deltaproteobacteria bacterium]